ncbi:heterokaryon incompatibility protein-domain-containing protein [Clohesyomyces aquaticus]|uniref:Heterokaryon incompatibility protein-domain-containing protein n=1 Tax=Clohesyomyces aquaticus TaxID=1231657 RepID=A0A1Y1Z6D0_9PLEO|nr:heterokaryon incompatibility protein-domain-containing protein [Clohesyomyces aquaticus]
MRAQPGSPPSPLMTEEGSQPVHIESSAHFLYQYRELSKGQIRLLRLLPGRKGDPVRCEMFPALLSKPQPYEAISYVWGDPTITDQIQCDGGRINITANLQDVLVRLRYMDKARILWADAICIDQGNTHEKSEQVGLMGLIYWNASRVNIWLGKDEVQGVFSAAVAIALIKEIVALRESNLKKHKVWNKVPRYTSKEVVESQEGQQAWEAVSQLFERPYFKRVWVVQEVGLADEATFYCGESTFSRLELDKFVDWLSYSGEVVLQFYHINLRQYHIMNDFWKVTRGNTRLELGSDPTYKLTHNFMAVLDSVRGLHCTDPRDAIYAFLGHPSAFKISLLDSSPYMWYPRNFIDRKTVIDADYDKELPELYYEVATSILLKYDLGPTMFHYVAHNADSIDDDFPSWVPRWDVHGVPRGFRDDEDINCKASRETTHEPYQIEDICDLKIRAVRIDAASFTFAFPAADCFPMFNNIFIYRDNTMRDRDLNPIEDLLKHFDAWNATLPIPVSNTYRHDIISVSQTLTAGLVDGLDPPQHLANFAAYRLQKASVWGPDLSDFIKADLESQAEYGKADQYFVELQSACSNRAFFCTKEGYIGLGPVIMEEGDQCWVPKGSSVPIVLRRVEEEEKRYKILGLAYIHGIMREEAVKEVREEDWESIVLC